MKTLIVYDSKYGNTEKIAKSIGDALTGDVLTGDVKVLRVDKVNLSELESINLCIIGSPTHGFRPSKPAQKFLDALSSNALKGIDVAAFDTRMPASEVAIGLRLLMKIGGYAAPRIAGVLEKKGGNLAVSPEGFLVKGREGPLKKEELERAASWAKKIVK